MRRDVRTTSLSRPRRSRPPLALTLPISLAFALSQTGCYLLAPPQYYGSYEKTDWQRGFGYLSGGYVVHADFFGNITGVEPGQGLTVTMPPLVPVAFGLYILAFAAEIEGTTGAMSFAEVSLEEVLYSGVSDPSGKLISDFSVDLSYSWSTHRDRAQGGGLDYQALMLGLRLAGPRFRVPRYWLVGGIGWYRLDYDNRPDADAVGPYVGLGLELFVDPRASVSLDYKFHFYFGEDEAGNVLDGGARQLAVGLSLYW